MYKSLKKSLYTWSTETSERQKMQHTYIATVIALIVVAGLVGLVNYHLSQNILAIAFLAAAVWVVNLIVWALLQSLVILPLDKNTVMKTPTPTRKRTTRK